MAETFDEGVRRVSRHEAGHYIVGEVNGFTMGQIRYIPGQEAGAQGIFIKPVKSLEDVLQLIDQRAEVLLAGVMAETWDKDDEVWSQKANRRFTEEGARQDKAKFAELLYLRQSIVGLRMRHGIKLRSPSTRVSLLRIARGRLQTTLRSCWSWQRNSERDWIRRAAR